MSRPNRICTICKCHYSYCPTCLKDINKPTWRAAFCCDNCHDLYNVINDYRCKKITKEEALNKLKPLDLSCSDKLSDGAKKILDEITIENNIENNVSASEINTALDLAASTNIEQLKAIKTKVIKKGIDKPRHKKKAKTLNSDF